MKKIRKKEKISVREIKSPRIEEKKKKESKEEKSELEEQIEKLEIIEDSEFHEFLNLPSNLRSAPVLERIEAKEDLEENVASSPMMTSTQENANPISYVSGSYFSQNYGVGERGYEEPVRPPVLERTRTDNLPTQELLNWEDLQGGKRDSSWFSEREMLRTTDVEEKRELPFETKDKKYKNLKR